MTLQVGVKAILRKPDNTFLVLRRSKKCGDIAGMWDIPGGRIEVGEKHMDALEREVKEETGLELGEIKLSEPKIIASQDILKGEKHIIRLTFVVDIRDGEYDVDSSGDGENDDFKWVQYSKSGVFEDLDPYICEILKDA